MVPRLSPTLTCVWMAHIVVLSDDGGCCQVLQQEVERLEARAALVEEEASRAGQLEEEAVARGEQLRALQEKARAHNFDTRQNLQQYSSNRVGLFFSCQQKTLERRRWGRGWGAWPFVDGLLTLTCWPGIPSRRAVVFVSGALHG